MLALTPQSLLPLTVVLWSISSYHGLLQRQLAGILHHFYITFTVIPYLENSHDPPFKKEKLYFVDIKTYTWLDIVGLALVKRVAQG